MKAQAIIASASGDGCDRSSAARQRCSQAAHGRQTSQDERDGEPARGGEPSGEPGERQRPGFARRRSRRARHITPRAKSGEGSIVRSAARSRSISSGFISALPSPRLRASNAPARDGRAFKVPPRRPGSRGGVAHVPAPEVVHEDRPVARSGGWRRRGADRARGGSSATSAAAGSELDRAASSSTNSGPSAQVRAIDVERDAKHPGRESGVGPPGRELAVDPGAAPPGRGPRTSPRWRQKRQARLTRGFCQRRTSRSKASASPERTLRNVDGAPIPGHASVPRESDARSRLAGALPDETILAGPGNPLRPCLHPTESPTGRRNMDTSVSRHRDDRPGRGDHRHLLLRLGGRMGGGPAQEREALYRSELLKEARRRAGTGGRVRARAAARGRSPEAPAHARGDESSGG